MHMGETIRALRLERGVTQEQLAKYLSISPQSVSKWEKGNALPDITLVVPLASFFGVTTDTLFCRDDAADAAALDDYHHRDYNLAHIRTPEAIRARIGIWREAVQRFPREFDCLRMLAYALHDTLDDGFSTDEREQNAREMIEVCTRILRDCTEIEPRESAIQLLVFTYNQPGLPFADEARAVEYANMASSLYTCREVLLEQAYFTAHGRIEARRQRHENNLLYLDFLCTNLTTGPFAASAQECAALETAIRLWATLIDDENYLFYHTRLMQYHLRLAHIHAKQRQADETLSALTAAHRHAAAFDALPVDVAVGYTAPPVVAAASVRHLLDGCMESFRAELRESCFDFVRDRCRFGEK